MSTETLPLPKPVSRALYRPDQLVEAKAELSRLEEATHSSDPRVDKGETRKALNKVKQMYAMQAPEPITDGSVRDRVAKRITELREDIKEGMLSTEEMRKNPPGAVDRHRRWERAKKPAIMEYKNLQRQLQADGSDPETWDRDSANIEMFRSEGARERVRLDAQIPGKMAFTNVPEANWKEAFGKTHPDNSALAQAKRARPAMSDERKAKQREILARARAAKKAKLAPTTN
jgi:hypothetical protein